MVGTCGSPRLLLRGFSLQDMVSFGFVERRGDRFSNNFCLEGLDKQLREQQ